MEKMPNLSKIKVELMDQVQNLQELAGQVSQLGSRITTINNKLSKFDRDLELLEKTSPNSAIKEPSFIQFGNGTRSTENEKTSPPMENKENRPMTEPQFPSGSNISRYRSSNIIPFPESVMVSNWNSKKNPQEYRKNKFMALAPFLATPGMSLPPNVPDYRPHLQRDGLILLAWDKRETETGVYYTAYWVTSTGIPRFYASKPLPAKDFFSARPHHKSYAAEDGIEFYGQEAPFYIVHVAPDLMKSNPKHGELRETHIKLLESQGIKVDFNYKYLLKTEKKRNLPLRRSSSESDNQTGA